MRPFTPRKRTSTRPTTSSRAADRTLEEILAGPDDAHRREIETMLEDSLR